MFDTSHRPHPVQTFQFWFVVLSCFVVVSAWKLGLFTFPDESPAVVTDEPMPPPPAQPPEAEDDPELIQTAAAPQQSEEPFPEEQVSDEELAQLEPLQKISRRLPEEHPNDLVSPEQLSSLPSESPIIRTTNSMASEMPAAVVQAVEERPAEHLPQQPSEPPTVNDNADTPVAIDLAQVDQMIEQGDEVGAHRLLSNWYWEYPHQRKELMSRLQLLARRIYFQPQPHYLAPYTVQFGDRLDLVARKYHLSPAYLAKLNRLDSQALQANQQLKVIQGPFAAVIDTSDFELTVHAQGYFLARFPLGFGTDCSIPEGTFSVTDKVVDPDYYGPQEVLTHRDPNNPLGNRWLTINNPQRSLQGFGIHSTNNPDTLGKIEGRGCIRLLPQDAEAVFDLLTIGSEVIIHP